MIALGHRWTVWACILCTLVHWPPNQLVDPYRSHHLVLHWEKLFWRPFDRVPNSCKQVKQQWSKSYELRQTLLLVKKFPHSLYHLVGYNLFVTRQALYLSIEPFALRLTLRTHLFPMVFRPGGRFTKSQTWFVFIDPISSFIALIHVSFTKDERASGTILGLSSSCGAIM